MRVFVTGMGMVSSLGKNCQETYQSIKDNKSASLYMSDWDQILPLKSKVAAPVLNWDNSFIPRNARRTMSKMSEMICLAYLEAQKMSGLHLERNQSRVLMIVGSTAGSQSFAEEFFINLRKNESSYTYCTSFLKTMGHTVATNLSIFAQFNGPTISLSAACATSSQSVVLAWELIQSGFYDVVICGGADEIDIYTAMVFDNVGAASTRFNLKPKETPRPFDKKRDGIVISEGASVLILESEKSLSQRQARPIVEILGGYYSRGSGMPTQNAPFSIVETLKSALLRSNINAGQVQYINAHATGTIQGDVDEALGIGEVFGKKPLVSGIKGYMGHSLAACGGIELALTAMMINSQEVLGTKNLTDVDLACEGINIQKTTIETDVKIAMSNNLGFGGINSSVVLKKIER